MQTALILTGSCQGPWPFGTRMVACWAPSVRGSSHQPNQIRRRLVCEENRAVGIEILHQDVSVDVHFASLDIVGRQYGRIGGFGGIDGLRRADHPHAVAQILLEKA